MVDVTVQSRSATRAHPTIALDFEGHGIGRLLVPLLVRREARKEMPVNVKTLRGPPRGRRFDERRAGVRAMATSG